MADIFVAVDGTGAFSDEEYAQDFSNSNLNRIHASWPGKFKYYSRGPSVEGSATHALAKLAASKAKHFYNAQGSASSRRIFLGGYSRGGSAVLDAAHHLKADGIPVHCMLLFDAVDRTTMDMKTTLASNVKLCYHAMRDPAAGSRESFGNCGPKHSVGGQVWVRRNFFCTHGAMGGTPFTEAGKSGKIEEVSTGAKAAGIGASFLVGPILGPLARRELDRHDFTNVTLEDENKGKDAVWAWMKTNLEKAKKA